MKIIKERMAMIQKEIGKMSKDKKGFNYYYVDINQILDKLMPLLDEYKLLLTQPLRVVGERTALFTRLECLDVDDVVETSIFLPDNVKPQDVGSAQTYYRRYSLVSLFSLRAEDDDAVKAQGSSNVVKVPYKNVATKNAEFNKNKEDKDSGKEPW